MNVRELLRRDQGVDVRISAGTGLSNDPYVVERCGAEEGAFTQVQLLRGIGRGLEELWRTLEWERHDIGAATEVIRIDALRFTPTAIETSTRSIYFDTRCVEGAPSALHPLTAWRGPPGAPVLPYELGWLHFDRTVDNSPVIDTLDQTILYSCPGAKASIYVYPGPVSGGGRARHAELERAAARVRNPELKDPWPLIEIGPFAMKFFLSASDVTAVGVAVSGRYFVKVRLTYFDDPTMRQVMNATLQALAACVQNASAMNHWSGNRER